MCFQTGDQLTRGKGGQKTSKLALLHKEGHLNFALTVTRGLEQQIQAAVIMEVNDQTMRRFIDMYDDTLCICVLLYDNWFILHRNFMLTYYIQ